MHDMNNWCWLPNNQFKPSEQPLYMPWHGQLPFLQCPQGKLEEPVYPDGIKAEFVREAPNESIGDKTLKAEAKEEPIKAEVAEPPEAVNFEEYQQNQVDTHNQGRQDHPQIKQDPMVKVEQQVQYDPQTDEQESEWERPPARQPMGARQKKSKERKKVIDATLENFRRILSKNPRVRSMKEIEKDQHQLNQELQKEANQSGEDSGEYMLRELDSARKNMTHKYLKFFKLVLQVVDPSSYDQKTLESLKSLLGSSVSTIPTVMKIYRQPCFSFFTQFLRKEIIIEERFPMFIMSLPMKPADKLVMLGGMQGMIFAINNTQITLGSWYYGSRQSLGDTSHIVKSIRERGIETVEIIKLVKEVYKKVFGVEEYSKYLCRFSNMASRFAAIIHQATAEAKKLELMNSEDEAKLKDIFKRTTKSSSIADIKEMLSIESLRNYLKTNFIDNRRLVIQVLQDRSLNCRTKLGIMESFEAFARATSDPMALKKWH